MNKTKLLDFAQDFGAECGAYMNQHPRDMDKFAKAARNRMAKILDGHVLVPSQLIQSIDDLTEAGFGAEDQIYELCELLHEVGE